MNAMRNEARYFKNKEKINVNSELEYKALLPKLRDDFEQRYEQNNISPNTGLIDFKLHRFIGKGSFGRVRIVRNMAGEVYAVKILQKALILKLKKVESVVREKRLLNAFRFPFLLWLEWSRKDIENLYLGLPIILGGDLFALHSRSLLICRLFRFSEEQSRFYAAQICLALEYLHALRIVYRDLKLENILIGKDGFIRLTDFGSSKYVEDRTFSLCGTPEYIAPEMINATPYFSGPDWWAFGVLVYEMVNGATPFYKLTASLIKMYDNILNCAYTMPPKFSENLKALVKNILVVDFTKRLGCRFDGVEEIKVHPWFNSVNWILYLRKDVKPPFVPTIESDIDTRYFRYIKCKLELKSKNRYSKEFEDF